MPSDGRKAKTSAEQRIGTADSFSLSFTQSDPICMSTGRTVETGHWRANSGDGVRLGLTCQFPTAPLEKSTN
jgi:hypothetical protein